MEPADQRPAARRVAEPLSGITVIEIGQYVAVPAAAQILRDQGATVYKVEPPGGEACRKLSGFGESMFAAYNRGKHMLELDLRSPEGKEELDELVAEADIVMSNLRPGALDQLGLGAERLRKRHPGLIVVTLSGFGESEQLARRPGLDIAAQAESGMMWVTGDGAGDPQRVGFVVVDAATGMAIAQACSTALVKRLRTGEGADIRVSLWDVALHLQAPNWMNWFQTGNEPVRTGNGQPTTAPAAEVIETRTGRVVLSAYTPQAWAALCNFLDRADLMTDPRFANSETRAANRPAMLAELRPAIGQFDRERLIDELTDLGVVIGAVRDYPSAYHARVAADDDLFIEVPGEQIRYIGPPVRWHGVQGIAERPGSLGSGNERRRRRRREPWEPASQPSPSDVDHRSIGDTT